MIQYLVLFLFTYISILQEHRRFILINLHIPLSIIRTFVFSDSHSTDMCPSPHNVYLRFGC